MNKLAILITVMLCFSLSVMADNQPKIKLKSKVVKIFTRSPLYLDVEVCESGQDLQIFFRGNLPDANVVVFDDEGNVVLHEWAIDIYDGISFTIANANQYPYLLEIVSPIMELTGEIVMDSPQEP